MSDHIDFMLLGLNNGAVFAALAVALVMTYRSSGVLNFATGALSLQAAYTYAFLRRGELLTPVPGLPRTIDLGGPLGLWPAMLLTLAWSAAVGVVLYLAVFRPLRTARPVAKAVGSLGVMVLLTALVSERAGPDQIVVAPIFPRDELSFAGVRVVADRLWFAVAIVGVSLALGALYRCTRFGLATRAAAETEFGALVTGLSPERVAVANWAISAAVAGLAGILIAPLVPLIPGTYTLFIVPALAAAVLGRFSALAPAVAGGLLVGALQSEAVFLRGRHDWFPQNGAAELVPLVLVLLVLVVRGQPLPTRGSFILQSLGRAPQPRSLALPLAVGVGAGAIALVVFQGSYRSAVINSLIFAVISLSLVVVTGYCGQISLAQLTLAGAAGFLLSALSDSWGVPFPLAPILAAAGATAIGVVVGLPALRIRGLLLGVVTLTLAVALEAVWFRNNDVNGGVDGAPIANPEVFGLDLGVGTGSAFPRPAFGFLCLGVLAAVAVGVARLRTSHLGSAMLAVRANERSAAAAGISVTRVKVASFAIGSFIAGVGGCLLAYKQTNVTFQSFSAISGLTVFSTAFLAGITSVAGGLVAGLIAAGGILFLSLDRAVDIGPWYAILSGVGVIVAVVQNPEGIVGPLHAAADRRRAARLAPAAPRLAPAAASATPAVADGAAPGGASPDGAVPADGAPTAAPAAASATPDGAAPESVPRTTVVTDGAAAADGAVAADGAAAADRTVAADCAPGSTAGRNPLLTVGHLRVAYGGVVAVDDVSFTVDAGSIAGLIGPNGAGKTTVMDALSGFAACAGTVELAGRPLAGLAAHRRALAGLGRTFQGLDLYDDLSVEENVVIGQHGAGRDRRRLAEVLDLLELAPLRERRVHELSQGQRQLVSVARALAGRPQLLLLDEPAAGLDSTESAWLADRLRAVRAGGTTILLVDHDMSLVLGLCDRIHVLDYGRLVASGPPEVIRSDPTVRAAYLGGAPAEAAPEPDAAEVLAP
ncbi:MAG TPA: branched-chain amino acid ABC transporter permease/ATP-binding protein [Acidimicrobiales bacterium]